MRDAESAEAEAVRYQEERTRKAEEELERWEITSF